jgi:hypothetical protein
MQLGDTPEETQAIWQNLPPLYWCLETPDLKPGAFALAEHSRRQGRDGKKLPLIVLQHVTGNVLFHATDETWRWRFRSGDTYFARYWIQTIRYLSRSKLADAGRSATLSADRAKYRQGEPVRLRVRFDNQRLAPPQDDGVTVVVEGPKHATQRLKLHRTAAGSGVFEGLLAALPPDDYHAWIAIPSLENHPPATEFSVVRRVGARGRGHQGPLLRLRRRHGPPPAPRSSRGPAGARRDASSPSPLERLADLGVIPRLAGQRVGAAQARRDGVAVSGEQ